MITLLITHVVPQYEQHRINISFEKNKCHSVIRKQNQEHSSDRCSVTDVSLDVSLGVI
jgi:hypothetical protein